MNNTSAAHNYIPNVEIENYYTIQIGFTAFRIDRRYQNVKYQGDGSFGCVVSAYDTIMKRAVAIKKIRNPLSDREMIKRVLREIKLLEFFSGHENIIELWDMMTDPPNVPEFEDLYLVTNLFEADLHKIIQSRQPLTENHFQFLFFQAFRGLKYIHTANVVHRDLKPSNLLVNASCDLTICDFGSARNSNSSSRDPLTEYVTTRYYRAPEILCECTHYAQAADIWSLGCIFAELITGIPVFRGETPLLQLQAILNKVGAPNKDNLDFIKSKTALNVILTYQQEVRELPHFGYTFPEGTSFLLLDLLQKMLQFHPDDRISIDAALMHPFLNQFQDQLPPTPICEKVFSYNFEKSYVNYDLIFKTKTASRMKKRSRLEEEATAHRVRLAEETAVQRMELSSLEKDACPTHSTAIPSIQSGMSVRSSNSSSSSSASASGDMEVEIEESEEEIQARNVMIAEMMVKEARHEIISHLSRYRRLNGHMSAFLIYGGPKCIL